MKQLTSSIQNKLMILVAGLGLVAAFSLANIPSVSATNHPVPCTENANQPKCEVKDGITGIGGGGEGRTAGAFTNIVERVINILLFIIGAAAVIMIIIGGIRYVVSGGDQGAVTGAKNTILYAVVGLVVAIMAYAIVNFVVTKL